jgi:hypothetical protein
MRRERCQAAAAVTGLRRVSSPAVNPTRRRWIDAALALALAAIAYFLYRKIGRLWWMFDDPVHLNILAVHRVGDYLFSAEFWRHFIAPVFTPLLLLSLRFDVAAFGLHPQAFYRHQLLGVVLIAPLLYALLRLWLPRPHAFLGALTAILGTPLIQISQLLMLRHYVEGLLLALAASIAFVVAARRDDRRLAIAAAVLTLGAMLAKEVFVPLPFILAMIPEGRRRRLLVPQGIALAIYTIWRLLMLGPELRGYGWTVRGADWPRVAATMPLRAMQKIAADSPAGWIVVALLLALLAMMLVHKRAWRVPLAIALFCATLPVLPVSIDLQPRYALGLWLLLVITAAFVTAAMRRGGIAVLVVLTMTAAVANRAAWAATFRDARRMSDEARILPMLRPDELLFEPASPPATLGALAALTRSRGHWSYDAQPLCGQPPPRRLFTYDEASSEVKVADPTIVQRRCAATRAMPLTATFAADGTGVLFWRLGPYRDGTYTFLLAPDGTQAFDVPIEGGYRLPNVPEIAIRVRYTSPAGWMAYSPERRVRLHADGAGQG